MYDNICWHLKLKLYPLQQKAILQTGSSVLLSQRSLFPEARWVFSSTVSCMRWCTTRRDEIRAEWGKGSLAWPAPMEQRGRTVFNFPWLLRYELQQVTNLPHQSHGLCSIKATLRVCVRTWARRHTCTTLCTEEGMCTIPLHLIKLETPHCVCKHVWSFCQQACRLSAAETSDSSCGSPSSCTGTLECDGTDWHRAKDVSLGWSFNGFVLISFTAVENPRIRL